MFSPIGLDQLIEDFKKSAGKFLEFYNSMDTREKLLFQSWIHKLRVDANSYSVCSLVSGSKPSIMKRESMRPVLKENWFLVFSNGTLNTHSDFQAASRVKCQLKSLLNEKVVEKQ